MKKGDMFHLTVSRLSTCSIASALGLCSIHLSFTTEKLASLIHRDLKKQHTKDGLGMLPYSTDVTSRIFK